MNDFCDVALQAQAAWLKVAFNKDFSHLPELHRCKRKQINLTSSADQLFFSQMFFITVSNIYLILFIPINLQLINLHSFHAKIRPLTKLCWRSWADCPGSASNTDKVLSY